jgi:serine/threonine protein phosphatase PrpC
VLSTNPNKQNQDRYLIRENLLHKSICLFAVADGHGANGHFVSQKIIESLSKQT